MVFRWLYPQTQNQPKRRQNKVIKLKHCHLKTFVISSSRKPYMKFSFHIIYYIIIDKKQIM